jgi:uncharacterized protein with GYD domain
MALYVGLAKMTREGASRIRDLAPEWAKARQYIESVGGKIICVTACFGEYDFVSVIDYPDQVAALKAAGYITLQGVVTVQTLPACAIDDFLKVMSGLPK